MIFVYHYDGLLFSNFEIYFGRFARTECYNKDFETKSFMMMHQTCAQQNLLVRSLTRISYAASGSANANSTSFAIFEQNAISSILRHLVLTVC